MLGNFTETLVKIRGVKLYDMVSEIIIHINAFLFAEVLHCVTITDPEDITNAFNSHYTTVAEKVLKQRKYNGNKSCDSYLKNPNRLSFMMTPTSPVEVEDIITKLDTSQKDQTAYLNHFQLILTNRQEKYPITSVFW